MESPKVIMMKSNKFYNKILLSLTADTDEATDQFSSTDLTTDRYLVLGFEPPIHLDLQSSEYHYTTHVLY